MTRIPGVTIMQAVITPNCRTVERPHFDSDPRMAAFDEAAARLRDQYRQHINRTDGGVLKRQNIRLALMAETKDEARTTTPQQGEDDGE